MLVTYLSVTDVCSFHGWSIYILSLISHKLQIIFNLDEKYVHFLHPLSYFFCYIAVKNPFMLAVEVGVS
jgi:hypothetical protein